MSLKLFFILNTVITVISLFGVIGEKENENLRKCLTVITCVGMITPIVLFVINVLG